MFQRLHDIEDPVTFTFDGKALKAERGQTLASALLASSIDVFRTSAVGGKPRAPYCLMGACFDCLVTVDGVQNRQSCLLEVRSGMVVTSQIGRRTLKGGTIQ